MTLAELKAEIEQGPLSLELAPYWSKVFDDPEPLRTKLLGRQGVLKPDAANDILTILNDSTKRTRSINRVSRGAFIAAVAPLSIAVAQLPEVRQKYWTLLLTLLIGGDEEVDTSRPQIGQIMDAAITDGILTEQQKAAIQAMGGTTTQSRLSELGWSVTIEQIQAAKAVV